MAEIQWKCMQWEVNLVVIMFLNFFSILVFPVNIYAIFVLFSDFKVSAKNTYAVFPVMYDIKNWNYVNIVLK